MSNLASFATNPNPYSGVFGTGRVRFFPASATFTIPAGITSVRVRVWGAGAVGSGDNGYSLGNTGGGGGFSMKTVTGLTPGGTVAVTVGTTSGATSSFGANCSATGGATGGSGGSGSSGDINNTGGASFAGTTANSGSPGGGAASMFGSGGTAGALGTGTGGAGAGGYGSLFAQLGASGRASSIGFAPLLSTSGNPTNSLDFIGCGAGALPDGGTLGLVGLHASNGGGGYGGTMRAGFPGGGGGIPSGPFGGGLVIVEY